MPGELLDKTGLHIGIGERRRFQQQARVGNRFEHFGPEGDGLWRELHGVVEGAEDGCCVGRSRRRQRVVVHGRPAEDAVRQLRQTFAVEVGVRRRGDHAVADQPVDAGESGRVGIAQEGGLHRGGALGKDAQPMRGGVSGQVDQNVDPVGQDGLMQRGVVQAGGLPPMIGAGLRLPGVFVVHGAGVVEGDFELSVVVALEQRQQEQVDRVLAMQVAGNVADAQSALRAFVVVECVVPHDAAFYRGAEFAVQRGDLSGHEMVLI